MAKISRGQYYKIREGLTATEKELINFYELQWHLRHNVPTVEQVVNYLNSWHQKKNHHHKVTHTAVNYYLQRGPVVRALRDRGIPFEQHTQNDLTQAQVATAITVMNFADTRPLNEKLDQMGINPNQYYAWLNDPQFKNLVENLADQNLRNIKPTAIAEFTKKVNQGDWAAIRYYLDATGTLQDDSQPKSEQLLMMIIEVIQRHVKDPQIMVAIAQDLKNISGNRTLEVVEEQPAIEAYAVEDPELVEAKRKLGIG